MKRVGQIRGVLALLFLTLWWGGFTFYASRVVFIGHQVLHSTVKQGFITEIVTTELNWIGLAALAFIGWELFAAGTLLRRTAWSAWTVALLTTLTLFLIHMKLSGMLDFSSRQIHDDEHFYGWHRLYLLITMVQWLASTLLLLVTFRPARTPS